jgi:hypothetical protein
VDGRPAGLFSLDGVHPTTVGHGLIATLITRPPQNIDSTLEIIEWADTTLGMIKRALQFKP